MYKLLRTKPMSMLQREASETGEHTLKRSLGAMNLITLGIGAIIGAGIFVLTGTAAATAAGPAVCAQFCAGGHYLRVCWALLRRVCLNHSHRGIRIHLWIRDARRTCGLDYWLGPWAGVRIWRGDGCIGVVRLFHQPLGAIAHPYSAATDSYARNAAGLLSGPMDAGDVAPDGCIRGRPAARYRTLQPGGNPGWSC